MTTSIPPFLLIGIYTLLAVFALGRSAPPVSIFFISTCLGAALVVLSVIDLRTKRLPDAITLPLIAVGLLLAFALGWSDPVFHLVAAVAGYLLLFGVAQGYYALKGRSGLGLGDAKLFAAAGAWVGLIGLPSVLLWACGIALLAVTIWSGVGRQLDRTTRIPFGPFLAIGFWIVWLFGPLI